MNTLHTIKKNPKIFILGNVVAWFAIGLIVSYFFLLIPFFRNIEFFNDRVSLGALLALTFGFVGGIFFY
jgi:hypothetical protein